VKFCVLTSKNYQQHNTSTTVTKKMYFSLQSASFFLAGNTFYFNKQPLQNKFPAGSPYNGFILMKLRTNTNNYC